MEQSHDINQNKNHNSQLASYSNQTLSFAPNTLRANKTSQEITAMSPPAAAETTTRTTFEPNVALTPEEVISIALRTTTGTKKETWNKTIVALSAGAERTGDRIRLSGFVVYENLTEKVERLTRK